MFKTSARLKDFPGKIFPRKAWIEIGEFYSASIIDRYIKKEDKNTTISIQASYAQKVGTSTSPDTCHSTRDSAKCEC